MKHPDRKIKVLVLFYSFTGNAAKLAKAIAAGAKAVPDTEVIIKQVRETLPAEFFATRPKLKKVRESLNAQYPIATADDLVEADAIAFGTPTHFGSFASQLKEFIDQLSPIWLQGKLVNKPAALFCTAGSLHGGEEATLISLMIPLINLGMIPTGIPYPVQGESSDFDAGSPYGAVYVTGGGKQLSTADKKVARILGARLASLAWTLNCECPKCQSHRELNRNLL